VQRQLNSSSTFEAAYVGEHGVKLQVLGDLNQAAANPLTATCNATTAAGCTTLAQRRPIQSFYTIEETLPQGFLAYNGLQAKFEQRTSHGLYILDSFTWSRAEDNASGHLDTPAGDNSRVNVNNILGDRGVSAYNQPLNNVLSLVYDLPFGKGRMFGQNANFLMQEILGGWQLTAIDSASSGSPVNVYYSPNAAQTVSTILVQRPNRNYGVDPVLPKSKRVRNAANTQFTALNSAAYTVPDNTTPFGTAQRNSARFDPFYQLDLGLHKAFALYPERVAFDFRVEAFNVLNQTNYAYPSSNVSSGFGTVNASATFPARIFQFAGKIIF
jgi:hypothetical protein